MSRRDDLLLLNDILIAGRRVVEYTTGMDFHSFIADQKTIDACIRNFEIMGEASSRLSDDILMNHPEIEWRKMKNYRNLLIHQYFGVNLEIVWDIITGELNQTLVQIEGLKLFHKRP